MRFRLFLCTLAAYATIGSTYGQTTITVDSTIHQAAVKRFGINLSFLSFWDSGQMMKNLVYRNPGFEPLQYQSAMRCASGTPMGCVDDSPWSTWPSGFWNGASYQIVHSGVQLRAGTITNFTGPSGSAGSSYAFDSAGVAPAPGDLIIIRKQFPGGSTAGWAVSTTGTGAALDETADLPPGTAGSQCVRLNAQNPGSSVTLSSFFDSTAGRTFVQLQGPHRISFSAKGAGGANQITVSMNRTGLPVAANQTFSLSPTWSNYTLDFNGNDTGSSTGIAQLVFSAQGSNVLLDDVSLQSLTADPANPTVFRDPVVNALKALHPGIIRYWGSQLGDSLDNQIAVVSGRKRSGYSAFSTTHDDLSYGLHEFLQLCEVVGAEPWYVFPVVTSETEAANLIEYLAGPASSPYGAKRAALGHPAPWTTSFSKIHLEFGNEAWNSIFKGGNIEYPDAYGQRAQTLIGTMRSNPYFVPADFDLIIGGQYDYAARTVEINANCNNHDTIAVAPYISSSVDTYDSLDNLFGPLFAEPQFESQTGQLRQEYDQINASARPVPMAVYETNMGTVGGAIPQTVLDQFTPSLGAGVAMASHMLTMLDVMGIRNQNLYALPQYQFLRPDGKQAKLWGAVVDMGATDRRRPQYLALQLMNQALSGDMITTTLSPGAPTWNQPLVNGIQLNQANYLQAFAFNQGSQKAMIIINLNRTSALNVTFAGNSAPSGTVTYQSLQGSSPMLTNEDQQNVSISTQTLTNFAPGSIYPVPPFSVNLLTWSGSGSGTPIPVPTSIQISNMAITGVTGSSATVQWTTNVPASTGANYGTSISYGLTAPASPALSAQHSVLLSGLASGTAYDVQAISQDAGGNTAVSANLAFSTLKLAPPAISNVQAAATATGAVITWTTDTLSDSQVEIGPTTLYGILTPLNPSLVSSHSVTIPGLLMGAYHLRVLSRDSSGNLTISVDIAVTLIPPAAPQPVYLNWVSVWNVSNTGARITWTTDHPADSQVDYGTDPGQNNKLTVHDLAQTGGHQIDLTGLTPGTTYYFRLTSTNLAGGTGSSSIQSFTTAGSQILVVSNIAVTTIAPGTALVTWNTSKPTDGQVEYGTTTTFGMWSSWDPILKTQHQALLPWTPSGQDYFRIRANDFAGSLVVTDPIPFTMP